MIGALGLVIAIIVAGVSGFVAGVEVGRRRQQRATWATHHRYRRQV